MRDKILLTGFAILFTFVCLYIFSKLLGPIPLGVNSVTTTRTDMFTSTGTGEVSATPTKTNVTLGVTKTASTAEAAKNEANKVINAVTTDLKAMGIPAENIKTVNFSVNPDYSEVGAMAQPAAGSVSVDSSGMTTTSFRAAPAVAEAKPTAYTATATIEIQTTDVETANKAIDSATANGANVVNGAAFDVSDEEREKLEDQAREKAITDAKENAEKIAKAAGIKLGKITNIQESGGMQPVFMSARTEMKAADMSAPTDLQPGENTISVTVTLFYETL